MRQSVSWPAATITNSAELNFISVEDLHRTAEELRNEETKLVFNILPPHPNSPTDSYADIQTADEQYHFNILEKCIQCHWVIDFPY